MKSVLEILKSTRDEAAQIVDNPEASHDARLAWYFCHIGEIEMAWFLSLISEQEKDELTGEWKKHHPPQTPDRTYSA